MFDDLFNKYGKVVYKSDDLKSPTAEVDDDAESLACNKQKSLLLTICFLNSLALLRNGEIHSLQLLLKWLKLRVR